MPLLVCASHDDVIKWKHFPRYWPFVRVIHWSPVNSPHKGQWRGALMFSLICVWINGWVNNREAGDLRRYRAHYDVIVMWCLLLAPLPSYKCMYILTSACSCQCNSAYLFMFLCVQTFIYILLESFDYVACFYIYIYIYIYIPAFTCISSNVMSERQNKDVQSFNPAVTWFDLLLTHCHMATYISLNTGSSTGLVPDGTKPLPKPMLTNHRRGIVSSISYGTMG